MDDERIVRPWVKTAVIAGIAAVAVVIFRSVAWSPRKPVLRVCAWSNYLTDEVLADFERQTDTRVEVSVFSSNEELFAKLRAGATGYDIIQPSDYMSRRMIQLGMLQPLDHDKLPNLKNLESDAKNPSWDPGLKFTVPFSQGTTGLVINTAAVKIPEGTLPGWDLLFNSPDPRHTSLLDDMREVFSAMLIWRGHSPNTLDSDQIGHARDALRLVREKILLFTSEPRQYLTRSEITIAHAYSTDAFQAMSIRPEFNYFIPREGAIQWADNFAIPESARNVPDAYRFLNFILDAGVASQLAHEGAFSTPNAAAKALLPESERNNSALYPDAETKARLHHLEELGASLTVMNRMWAELKI